ncbi:MAG: winged helix-turn-helix domain-containing protein [Oscillospiraceae bacterium]
MSQPQKAVFSPLHASVQVRISDDSKPIFGPGTAQLLDGIAKYGSVQRSCMEMGLSYSKGRKMLKELEQSLGVQVANRTQGGYGGGSASLTEEGLGLLQRYHTFEEDIHRYARERFSVIFAEDLQP